MKTLSRDEMKKVMGGKSGCDYGPNGQTFCNFANPCPNQPGYIDFYCDVINKVCMYCN